MNALWQYFAEIVNCFYILQNNSNMLLYVSEISLYESFLFLSFSLSIKVNYLLTDVCILWTIQRIFILVLIYLLLILDPCPEFRQRQKWKIQNHAEK